MRCMCAFGSVNEGGGVLDLEIGVRGRCRAEPQGWWRLWSRLGFDGEMVIWWWWNNWFSNRIYWEFFVFFFKIFHALNFLFFGTGFGFRLEVPAIIFCRCRIPPFFWILLILSVLIDLNPNRSRSLVCGSFVFALILIVISFLAFGDLILPPCPWSCYVLRSWLLGIVGLILPLPRLALITRHDTYFDLVGWVR